MEFLSPEITMDAEKLKLTILDVPPMEGQDAH